MNPLARFKQLYWHLYRQIISDPYKIAQSWRSSAGMNIGAGTRIYKDVSFGRGGKDPITIGKNCVLTGCVVIGHDASTNQMLGLRPGESSMRMPVVIEDNCFIGTRALILMGVCIGENSIVGAGAVVTRDVPPRSVVAGNPARVLCSVDELVEKRKQLALQHPEYFPHALPSDGVLTE